MKLGDDLMRIALMTLTVVIVLDILTHGNAAIGIANAVGGAWARILSVLAGNNPAIPSQSANVH